jgi:hypothetical protein
MMCKEQPDRSLGSLCRESIRDSDQSGTAGAPRPAGRRRAPLPDLVRVTELKPHLCALIGSRRSLSSSQSKSSLQVPQLLTAPEMLHSLSAHHFHWLRSGPPWPAEAGGWRNISARTRWSATDPVPHTQNTGGYLAAKPGVHPKQVREFFGHTTITHTTDTYTRVLPILRD